MPDAHDDDVDRQPGVASARDPDTTAAAALRRFQHVSDYEARVRRARTRLATAFTMLLAGAATLLSLIATFVGTRQDKVGLGEGGFPSAIVVMLAALIPAIVAISVARSTKRLSRRVTEHMRKNRGLDERLLLITHQTLADQNAARQRITEADTE